MNISVKFDDCGNCGIRCDVTTDRGFFCMWAKALDDCEFELDFDEWAVENDPSLSGLFEDDQAMQEIYHFVESALAIRLKNDELSKLLDDEIPAYGQSRTGANRQKYNGLYFAEKEVGKTKILSKCIVTEGE